MKFVNYEMCFVRKVVDLIAIFFVWSLCVLFLGGKATAEPYIGKRLLFVDSYHAGYEWSDGVRQGVVDRLRGTGVDLHVHHMDTKRNTSEEFKREAALRAKQIIEETRPDVVIACDDNASKYLVQPYFKDSAVPFVFCGVNMDASPYGYPYSNATGMVEVDMPLDLISLLGRYARGGRVGAICDNVLTCRKWVKYYTHRAGLKFDQVHYPETFTQWKEIYRTLQQEVDLLLFVNNSAIKKWDHEAALEFIQRETLIPSGALDVWLTPYTLMGLTKDPMEQGNWAADTALKILGGTKPGEIPVTTNKRGKLYLNVNLVKKLGLLIDRAVYKRAEIVE